MARASRVYFRTRSGSRRGTRARDVVYDVFARRPNRVGSDGARGAGERPGTEVPDAVEFGTDRRAVDALDGVGFLDAHAADVHETAEHVGREASTLFVAEECDGEWTGRGDARSLKCFDDFEPREHPQVAVVTATRADGVDV